MKKQFRQTIRQGVNAYNKKKGDGDLNMLDDMLSEFNYADMDNMNIDSDGDMTPKRGRSVHKDLAINSDDAEVSV